MNKLLLIGGAFGAYWLYNKIASQPTVTGLPAGATQVQTLTLAGIPINVYMAASGYYAQFTNPKNNQPTILGPYSQAQVSALLNAQTSVSSLLSSI